MPPFGLDAMPAASTAMAGIGSPSPTPVRPPKAHVRALNTESEPPGERLTHLHKHRNRSEQPGSGIRPRLPSLPALRVFEAVGRRGSRAAAAEELGITPSAVSHAVRALEDALGQPLFRRGPRGFALTPAGQDLLREARVAFDRLAAAVERLTTGRAEAGLLVSAAPSFAVRWLLPKLPALRRRHPSLNVTITTERDWVALDDGRCDLAIRMAPHPNGPGTWRLLARERLVPVAAPSALRRLRTATVEEALRALPAIHVTSVREDWAAWCEKARAPLPEPSRGLRFDTIHMALDAAVQGLGVVLGRLPIAASDIAAGRLTPLDGPEVSGTAYWLVARPGALRQRDARLFTAWLQEELAKSEDVS